MKRFCLICSIFSLCCARSIVEHVHQVQASRAYRAADFAQAQRRYSDLTAQNPGDVSSLMGLGNSLYQQKQYEPARAAYDRAAAAGKNTLAHEQALFNGGCAAAAGADYQRALGYFERVVVLNPKNERARKNVEILKKMLEKSASKNKAQKQHNRPDQKRDDAHQNQNCPADGGQEGKTKDSGKPDAHSGDNDRNKQDRAGQPGNNAAGQNAASKQGQQQPNNVQSEQQAAPQGTAGPEQKGSDNGKPQEGQSNKSIHAPQRTRPGHAGQLTAGAALKTGDQQLLAQVQALDQQGRRLYARAQAGASKNGVDDGW